MPRKHHESPQESVESVRERVADIYQSLHLLNFSTKPPVYSPDQAATPGLVYHALPGNSSIHIGHANSQNTPPHLRKWREGAAADFVVWFNRHQRGGVVSTPYYLGTTTGDITEPFIVTPKDEKRFRALTPSEGEDSRRWQAFVHIIEDAEALGLPKPPDESTVQKLTA